MIIVNKIETKLGEMTIGIFTNEICLLEFNQNKRIEFQYAQLKKVFDENLVEGEHNLIGKTQEQITAYFNGELTQFDLPLNLSGNDFQNQVWNLLLKIPFATTNSYGQLARAAGDKKKVRAVGRANGENRISIIVPCHRVIGADGSLVGYGGELWRKKELLDLERKVSGKPVQMGFDF